MATEALPPPNGQVLSLVSALSNADNHDVHVQAIRARDDALSASPESYSNLCLQLAYVLTGCDRPAEMLRRVDPAQLQAWQSSDPANVQRLQQDENRWIPFGQMAGLILKNALLRPPIHGGAQLHLISPASDQVKQVLLQCLACEKKELRAVATSIIASMAVDLDSIQPALVLNMWPQLLPAILHNLQQDQTNYFHLVEGSLITIQKMMEDGPDEIRQDQLDALIPLLIRFLASPHETSKLAALQAMNACLSQGIMPSALVLHFNEYLDSLSALANDSSTNVRKWVCRSIVTL